MIAVGFGSRGGPAAVQRLQRASPEVRARLHIVMEYIGAELLALMKSKASVLQRRTGKLQRSFYTRVAVLDGGNRYVLTTGVSRRAYYAAFQDKGVSPKSVDVKGYARSVKSRNVKEGRRRTASGVGFVSAYRRQMHLTPEPFIGVSLAEMRSIIVREVQLAVSGGIG